MSSAMDRYNKIKSRKSTAMERYSRLKSNQPSSAMSRYERLKSGDTETFDISPSPEFSLAEKLQSAFELTGSLTREGIMQFEKGFKPEEFGKILGGGKRVTANQFKKFMENQFGLDLTLGDNGDQDVTESVGNFIVDFGIDILTDPIGNALWAIPKKVVKGLKGFGALKNLTAAETKLLTGAAVGGTIGLAGRSPEDEDAESIMLDVAQGAVLGTLGVGAVQALKRVGPDLSGAVYDGYIKMTRPEIYQKFLDKATTPSMARRTAKAFRESPEAMSIRRNAFNDRIKILKELDEIGGGELVGQFVDIRDRAFMQTIKKRNELIKAIKAVAKAENKPNLLNESWDEITRISNTFASDWVETTIRDLPNAPALHDGLKKYVQANRKIIDQYNIFAEKKGNGLVPLNVPIDFHTADLLKGTRSDDDVFKVFTTEDVDAAMRARTSENLYVGQDLPQPVSAASRELLSAEKIMGSLADDTEKAARATMAGLMNTPVEDGLFKHFEAGLEVYDNIMSFIKRMHLTFTHSWLQNNYIDNTMRAYLIDKGGAKLATQTALGASPLAAMTKNSTFREMLETVSPVDDIKKFKPLEGEIGVAQDLGVIDNNFFRDVEYLARENYGELMARVGKNKAEAILTKMRNRGHLSRIASEKNPLNIITDKVRQIGSASENASRMISFRHFYKTYLDEAPELKKLFNNTYKGDLNRAFIEDDRLRQVFKRAAKSVNDTFFDYGNVLEIEQSVLKRLMPYYTFFSRNFDYWAKQFTENTGSINQIMKLQANLGRPLTAEERMGVPDWLLEQGARAGEKTPDGLTLKTIPNISFADAMRLLNLASDQGSIGDETLSKLSPPIKAAFEQFRGREFFLDQPITKKEGVRGRGKRVFAQGLPAAKLLQQVGIGQLDISEKGKATTKDEFTARMTNLQQNLLPLPIVSNILQIREEVKAGQSLGGRTLERGPVKSRLITLEQALRNKTRRTDRRRKLDGKSKKKETKKKDTGRVK